MKKALFFIPLFLVFFCSLCLAADNVVQLKVNTDKSVYRPGDPVVITVSVENISSEEIEVVIGPYPFLNVSGSEHRLCDNISQHVQMDPWSKATELLVPHQIKTFRFNGSINKGQADIDLSHEKGKYKTEKRYGIIWDTGEWGNRYLLPGPGKYYFDFSISGLRGKDFQIYTPIPPGKGSFEVGTD